MVGLRAQRRAASHPRRGARVRAGGDRTAGRALRRDGRVPVRVGARHGAARALRACPSPSRSAARAATSSRTPWRWRRSREPTPAPAITLEAAVSLGIAPLVLFGSAEQRERWLPPLLRGERLWSFGLTEPEAGSDAGATRTTARSRRRRMGDQRPQGVHHQRRHRHQRRRDHHRGDRLSQREPRDHRHRRGAGHARLHAGAQVPQARLACVGHARARVRRRARAR